MKDAKAADGPGRQVEGSKIPALSQSCWVIQISILTSRRSFLGDFSSRFLFFVSVFQGRLSSFPITLFS